MSCLTGSAYFESPSTAVYPKTARENTLAIRRPVNSREVPLPAK